MLEITAAEIATLSDGDLSELVLRLCEIELVKRSLPTSHLTSGGAQDASDGGVDVQVDAPDCIGDSGYIPRGRTIFQVKATPMPRREILKEMQPGGILRPAIAAVLQNGGAYIIACSKTSPAGAKLQVTRDQMEITAGESFSSSAVVDFLGPDRIALWCRRHASVSSWALAKVGRPMEGWLPYGDWSKPGEGVEAEFLLDQDARLVDERTPQDGALAVADGLDRVRGMLRQPRASLRLVGLSGVGKTRLVQALFDGRVGEAALPASLALYCDYGTPVSPAPIEVGRRLVSDRERAVLLVDNCSPEVHRALSAITSLPSSNISLLTVEYDVRDDDMEGTEVFRLEPASEEVTEGLIKRRYSHIGATDRRRIAMIAGGNARIAMALAHTVRKGESLGRLRDEGLFERLFFQRNAPDAALVVAAEVAALVYSFDGERDGPGAELTALATLADQTVTAFRTSIAELGRRDLLQKRSQWRAVLPHAIANRLAARALDRMDTVSLTAAVEAGGERLLRSFSRRLSFLHDVPAAQALAEAWLADDGRLGRLEQIGELDFSLLKNLAPLAPEAALDAILRGAAVDPGWSAFKPHWGMARSRHELARLLRALAFDAPMFDRAAGCLTDLALGDTEADKQQSNRSVLEGLFKLYLSGTMATPVQRTAFVRSLLQGGDDRIALGFDLLEAMLESGRFGSGDAFDFGARPRSYGWEPKTSADVADWFKGSLMLLVETVQGTPALAGRAKQVLANHFRGLWWNTGLHHELSDAMATLSTYGFWPEGWIAVRTALKYAPEAADLTELTLLEERLRPTNLLEKARTYGFSKGYGSLDIDELDDGDDPKTSRWDRVEEYTKDIAKAVAVDDDVRAQLLPDLVRTDVQRHWAFGEGLALGAADPAKIWLELVGAIHEVPSAEAEPAVLRSFLRAWSSRDANAVEVLFDPILVDPVLGRWLPFLQTAVLPLDRAGVDRIKSSFGLGLTTAWSYHTLAFGRVLDDVSALDLATIIAGLLTMQDGHGVALHLFQMKLFSVREHDSVEPGIRQIGKEILTRYPFGSKRHREAGHLAEIVERCLEDEDGADAALKSLRRLRVAVDRYGAYGHEFNELVRALFKAQPRVSLDFFLGRQFRAYQGRYSRTLLGRFDFGAKPITAVSEADLLGWAAVEPGVRHRRLARSIPIFVGKEPDTGDDADRWWPPALALLDAAPNRSEVLAEFGENIRPMSWSGSLADILARRRNALRKLDTHHDPIVRSWATKWQGILSERAEQERKRETRREQSFE